MNVYRVFFKAGLICNENILILAEDMVAAAKKAERIRKENDYVDITSISSQGEVEE